ncbi:MULTISPECIES: hypothetical protein [unclassified Streptomyces]|uniref:hypothetical protein n=1 Tax=unclassified Streptomyces TaxID=2593676 RepID=UPI002024BDBA|nr:MULTISPECIES: hypothetical protein [unclassified Streptomyces]MCX4550534.1 hypothetical protein [Streptomyces sp. NBC_01500]WSC21981.1 hypothetical protein OIE60_21135 [Streptomyces sp. NBC_01766]
MSGIILAAMIAASVLLPVAVVTHRVATAPPEEPNDPADYVTSKPPHNPRTCALCAPLRHPSSRRTRRVLAKLPRQSAPFDTSRENGGSR